MKKYPAKKVALAGLFLAHALIVSLLESLIPPLVPALPYAKLGLANAVLLACFLLVGAGEGFVVLLLKCLLAAVFSGNFAALAWSVPASLAAYAVMIAMCKARIFSITAVSAVGGAVHNAVQIAVGMAAAGAAVAVYLPYMLLAGAVAGVVTGVLCHFAVAVARRGSLSAREGDLAYVRIARTSAREDEPEEETERGEGSAR